VRAGNIILEEDMRTTQYVGLNKYAHDWLEGRVIETFDKNLCRGMFNEQVQGTIYHVQAENPINLMYIAEEVVQDMPWSSGPMIFTALRVKLLKKNGHEVTMEDWFRWMLDPNVTAGYDYETGRYFL